MTFQSWGNSSRLVALKQTSAARHVLLGAARLQFLDGVLDRHSLDEVVPVLLRAIGHRAELQDVERLAILADPALAKEDGAVGVELDHESDCEEQRREEKEHQRRQDEVERALQTALTGARREAARVEQGDAAQLEAASLYEFVQPGNDLDMRPSVKRTDDPQEFVVGQMRVGDDHALDVHLRNESRQVGESSERRRRTGRQGQRPVVDEPDHLECALVVAHGQLPDAVRRIAGSNDQRRCGMATLDNRDDNSRCNPNDRESKAERKHIANVNLPAEAACRHGGEQSSCATHEGNLPARPKPGAGEAIHRVVRSHRSEQSDTANAAVRTGARNPGPCGDAGSEAESRCIQKGDQPEGRKEIDSEQRRMRLLARSARHVSSAGALRSVRAWRPAVVSIVSTSSRAVFGPGARPDADSRAPWHTPFRHASERRENHPIWEVHIFSQGIFLPAGSSSLVVCPRCSG